MPIARTEPIAPPPAAPCLMWVTVLRLTVALSLDEPIARTSMPSAQLESCT